MNIFGLLVMIIWMTKQSLHRPNISFKDSHLNNTMVTINKSQELTLNCRVSRKQVIILFRINYGFCIMNLN